MATLTADEKREAIAHARGFEIEDLEEAMMDGGIETADGCWVEPDGRCAHGYPSPLRILGYI